MVILLRILLVILIVILVFFTVVLLYCNKPYPEAAAIAKEMTLIGRDYWFIGDSGVGFLLFSGAESDDRSYAYLAKLLHDAGHTVVIPKQRFQMSAFGTGHGREIIDTHPEIKKWILIGHSLGGMPVTHVAETHAEHLTGIVFLATYASADLTGLPFPALRISADHDGVMNNERMDAYAGNLPAGSKSVMLTGANHRGFGGYQSRSKRDGHATMTWQEQNEEAIRLVLAFYEERITAVTQGET